MSHACGRCPAPPMTPPSSPGRAPSRSASPPTLPSRRRRRLWSPPMRHRSPSKTSRSSASSTAPRIVQLPRRLSPDAATTSGHRLPPATVFRPPSRSRRSGHRTHHDSRPPSTAPLRSDDVDAPGRHRRRNPSPTASSSAPSTEAATPPRTPPDARRLLSVLTRPPQTRPCNRGSRSVASTLLSSARKRAQARPPSPTDVDRINRKLRALAL